jgi:hypothetical protein
MKPSQKKDFGSPQRERDLRQVQGGPEIQPTGIPKYSEELKQGTNAEIGAKNYFEIASCQLITILPLTSPAAEIKWLPAI